MKKILCVTLWALLAVLLDVQADEPVCVEGPKGYNCWPMIQAMGGKLVCVYTMGTRHDPGEKGRGTFARVSSDGGKTWGPCAVVACDPRCGESPVAKGLDETGAALFWVRRFGPAPSLFALYRTTDGEHFELIAEPKLDKGPWMQITDVFKVPTVGLMCFWFGGSYQDDDRPRRWGVTTSADNGRTWNFRVIDENMKVQAWPTEPSGVYLGNGRILCVTRTERGGRQMQATSTDYGRTWKVVADNVADAAGSTPSLLYDDKTGLVRSYYYQRGKSGVLRRRTAHVDEVFDHPDAWPASEILDQDGGYIHHAGNANATSAGGMDYVAYYSGDETNCSVKVMALPSFSPKGRDWGVPAAYSRDMTNLRVPAIKVTKKALGENLIPGHQQGIAASDEAIYFGASGALGKIAWDGTPLIVKRVAPHMGDVAWYKGRLYTTWIRFGKAKKDRKNLVAVFDANLEPVREMEVPDVPGVDGITVLDGIIYFGVDDVGRTLHRKNRIGRMTLDGHVLGYTEIDIGTCVNYGVQNLMAADGKIYAFFYTHLGTRPGSPRTCAIFDRNLKLLDVRQAYSGQGIDVAPARYQTVPGKTVFVRGGSPSMKAGAPDDFVRLWYRFVTISSGGEL